MARPGRSGAAAAGTATRLRGGAALAPLLALCLLAPLSSLGGGGTLVAHAAASQKASTVQQQQAGERPRPVALPSAFGWRACQPQHVHIPESTDEVADLVGGLYRDQRATGRDYLLRATSPGFFGHNNLSCADGADGATVAVVVDTSRLDRVLALDVREGLVTVQAGITFEALEEHLLLHGLGLPGWVAVPQYAAMTLGAALDSGAHGSALDGPASLAAFLESAVLVDGTGQVLVLEAPGDLLEGSLGLLGIVTELVVRVGPARKAAVQEVQQEDLRMLEDIRELIEHSEAVSMDVTWSPAASLYTARVWHEVAPDTDGNAQGAGVAAPASWLASLERLLQKDQEDQEGSAAGYDIMCELVGDITSFPSFASGPEQPSSPPGGSGGGEPGVSVGWAGRLAGARCGGGGLSSAGACLWTSAKVTPHSFALPSAALAEWIDDVRSVVGETAGCPPFVVHLRFVMERGAPLSPSAGRQVVAVNVESLSSRRYADTLPHKHQSLLDEVLQLSLCKFSARPHWALSTNRMLTSRCPLRLAYGAGFDVLAARRARYDPSDMFLPPLFSRIEAASPPPRFPGCALSEECFCESDEHCGPGFACSEGRVFPEYRVCRMWGNENAVEL